METVEKIFAFLNSYPNYAKAGVIACLVGVIAILFFTPRNSGDGRTEDSLGDTLMLDIGEVRLFPQNSDLDIRVIAIAGGTRYVHPSVGGVEWMRVGPQMSHKTVKLPKLEDMEILDIRFEIEFRDGANLIGKRPVRAMAEGRFASQIVIDIDLDKLPHSNTFSLYRVNEVNSRSANIGAEIDYTVYRK